MRLTHDNALYRRLGFRPGAIRFGPELRYITRYVALDQAVLGAILGATHATSKIFPLVFQRLGLSIRLLPPPSNEFPSPVLARPCPARPRYGASGADDGGLYIGHPHAHFPSNNRPPRLFRFFFASNNRESNQSLTPHPWVLPHSSPFVSPYSPEKIPSNSAKVINGKRLCVCPGLYARGACYDPLEVAESGHYLDKVRIAQWANTGGRGYRICSYAENVWTKLNFRIRDTFSLIVTGFGGPGFTHKRSCFGGVV